MKFLGAICLLILLPSVSHAAGVIGLDSEISITPLTVLTTTDPDQQGYVDTFNYFFSLPIIFGMVGFWLRLLLRIFKL